MHIFFFGFISAIFAPVLAYAQENYPTRAVRIIVPTTPGAGTDLSARVLAQDFSKRWNQSVVVDNRAGAGTIVGTELAAKASPDGYTLLMAPGALATIVSTYRKLPFDVVRDFAPIMHVLSAPQLLVVHPSLPAKNAQEFIALAKARPGMIQYAAAGHGTLPHLSMALFASMAKVRLTNVLYKGNSGLTDLMGGRIEASMSASLSLVVPHVRTGRLRGLGVSSATRLRALPDTPTIAESGVPGYEAMQWAGLLAPAGTPRDIVARLHKETVSTLSRPELVEHVVRDGSIVVAGTPEAFAAFIKAEITKWAGVVKAAGIQPE
jgi:tripartite-type tricarboxylate transporter receptor subunit TctC